MHDVHHETDFLKYYYRQRFAQNFHHWDGLLHVPNTLNKYSWRMKSIFRFQLRKVESECEMHKKRWIVQSDVKSVEHARKLTLYHDTTTAVWPVFFLISTVLIQVKVRFNVSNVNESQLTNTSVSWWLVLSPLLFVHIFYFFQICLTLYPRETIVLVEG